MLKDKKILVIGAGTMGKALIKGLLASIDQNNIKAVERNKSYAERAQRDIVVPVYANSEAHKAIQEANIIVLCVKPQDVATCINDIKQYVNDQTLIISIAAGTSTSFVESVLQSSNPVIRAMPNTPCLIKEGMTVVCKGTHANADHIKLAIELFDSLGETMELEEKHLNTVTGLSGSGPAFIYLIIEALSDGGVMEGLPRKVATKLVAKTMLGAAKMVLETGKHPAELKDEVSTPAGCTIGAILSLEDGRLRSVLARSVQEAARIASSLGS